MGARPLSAYDVSVQPCVIEGEIEIEHEMTADEAACCGQRSRRRSRPQDTITLLAALVHRSFMPTSELYRYRLGAHARIPAPAIAPTTSRSLMRACG